MSAPPRRSLRTRLIAACLVIEVAMLTLVIGNTIRLVDRHMAEAAQGRLRQMEDSLAAAVPPPLAARDGGALAALAQRLGKLDAVAYVAVLDAEGIELAAAGPVPAPLPPPAADISPSARVHHARWALADGDKPLGEVRYGLSTRFLHDARRDVLIQGAAIGALAIFFSTFALVTAGVMVTARLKALTDASLRLAGGDYDSRVEVEGHDEVAALAQAFNTMAGAVDDKVSHLEASATVLRASNAELQRLTQAAATHLQDPMSTAAFHAGKLAEEIGPTLSGDARERLDLIQAGAMRARSLLTDLLNFIAIDMSPLPAGLTTDLNACAAQARQDLAEKIEAAGAKVTVDDLPAAHCDAAQVTTALRLLMENAIDHRGKEAPRVHIHASNDAGRIVVGITDNGPGVPSQLRDRIFELFETLDRRTSGTGFGLAAVRKIIRRHLGNVWITPAPGGTGLTVNFTLPKAPPGAG